VQRHEVAFDIAGIGPFIAEVAAGAPLERRGEDIRREPPLVGPRLSMQPRQDGCIDAPGGLTHRW
jgi:hypothetical protein